MITYLKLGAILALAAALFGGGFYFGGLRSKTAYEALQAAQAKASAQALLQEQAATAAQTAKLQQVQNAYDAIKDVPDPVALNVSRLLVAKVTGGCAVPSAPAVAGGAPSAPAVASGPASVAERLDDYIQACTGDARRLAAVQALSPNAVVSSVPAQATSTR
jgi:hypothetical protein